MSVIYRKGAYYPGTTQNGTTAGTNSVTSAFSTTTTIVRVAVQNDTYVRPVTTNTNTASTTSMIIPGGGVEFFAVDGRTFVAYRQVSASGWISITELSNTTAETSGN